MTDQPVDIVIACCRDEADFVAAFVDFYFDQGFDHICLIDNGSVDGTLSEVLKHQAQDRIHVLRDPRVGYDKRLLEYYRVFEPLASRWTFFVDIDELVAIPGGIKAFAARLPETVNVLELPVAEMRPSVLDGVVDPLLSDKREARFQREMKLVWKKGGVHKIYCGKHEIGIDRYAAHSETGLFIRHYHTRSPEQLRTKLRNRIETDIAISLAEAEELSSFDNEARDRWISMSRRMLECDGWKLEQERLEQVHWMDDLEIRRWWEHRQRSPTPLAVSPRIDIASAEGSWSCLCIQARHATEGHSSEDHLVLLYVRGPSIQALDEDMLSGRKDVPVRIHSECLFGDTFGFRQCDCGQQLNRAMQWIEQEGWGIIIYLRQEGRGVGLFNKIRSLVVEHPDSFARNEAIGLPADARRFQLAARILHHLGVSSVRLLSGNPAKFAALADAGIECTMEPWSQTQPCSPEAQAEHVSKRQRGYHYPTPDLPDEVKDR